MTSPPISTLENAMRDLSLAVRLLFSRRHATLARMLALQTVRVATVLVGTTDPVRAWEAAMQVDRGLGRARCLQRLTRVDEWPTEEHMAQTGETEETPTADDTAAYLFAAVMNLSGMMPLAAEAHVFRLWYLAAHAENASPEAVRLFGDLRDLPSHQQLAVGARTVDKLDQRMVETARRNSAARPAVSPFGPQPVLPRRPQFAQPAR